MFLFQLLQLIYPDLYRVDNINLEGCLTEEDENGGELLIPQPDRLQLSFERISATGELNSISKKFSFGIFTKSRFVLF